MDGYDVLLWILKSNDGQVRGRTAVQKLAYLAHCKDPQLRVPEYEPYYYGPTSAGLGQMLAKLVSFGFVSETKIVGEYAGYAYALTHDGEQMLEEPAKLHTTEYDSVSRLVSDCALECGLDILVLSAASKIRYLQAEEKMSLPEATDYTKRLKWIMREENASRGARLLQKLNLAA